MADGSSIGWLRDAEGRIGATWNPVKGCDEVSPGCANCYAKATAYRYSGEGQWAEGLAIYNQDTRRAEWTGKITLVERDLDKPLRWSRKPRRIFVCSGSDLFHKRVPLEFLIRIFQTMLDCQFRNLGHKFIVLTKRIKRMRNLLRQLWVDGNGRVVHDAAPPSSGGDPRQLALPSARRTPLGAALDNVIWGVTVEDQMRVARVPLLLDTPVRHRWLSVEPLLGPVDLRPWVHGIDWVVVGGESGHGARACALQWIERVMRDCIDAGVPPFVKQLGSVVVSERDAFPTLQAAREADPQAADRFTNRWTLRTKGDDPADWPEQLQWQQLEDGTQVLKPPSAIDDLTPLSLPL